MGGLLSAPPADPNAAPYGSVVVPEPYVNPAPGSAYAPPVNYMSQKYAKPPVKTVQPGVSGGRDLGRGTTFNPETRGTGGNVTRTGAGAIGSSAGATGTFNAGDGMLDRFMRNVPSATANSANGKPVTKRTYGTTTRRGI
jgi:hypothetical protein